MTGDFNNGPSALRLDARLWTAVRGDVHYPPSPWPGDPGRFRRAPGSPDTYRAIHPDPVPRNPGHHVGRSGYPFPRRAGERGSSTAFDFVPGPRGGCRSSRTAGSSGPVWGTPDVTYPVDPYPSDHPRGPSRDRPVPPRASRRRSHPVIQRARRARPGPIEVRYDGAPPARASTRLRIVRGGRAVPPDSALGIPPRRRRRASSDRSASARAHCTPGRYDALPSVTPRRDRGHLSSARTFWVVQPDASATVERPAPEGPALGGAIPRLVDERAPPAMRRDLGSASGRGRPNKNDLYKRLPFTFRLPPARRSRAGRTIAGTDAKTFPAGGATVVRPHEGRRATPRLPRAPAFKPSSVAESPRLTFLPRCASGLAVGRLA